MRACTVSTFGREVGTRGFRVAVGAGVRSGVVEGGCADSTFLSTGASLPMMSEPLTLAALVGGSC